jgi:transcriptional regulator GlxA family with amidase domain
LNKEFSQRYDVTVTEFLKREQVTYAQRLLRDTRFSIAKIAQLAAFGSRRSFHRTFARATGVTPQSFRLTSSNDSNGRWK